jgi:hypothetical protein
MQRRFRTNFVILATLTGAALWAVSPMSFAENPQVTVSVYDDAHVPRETHARAEGRAAKIFEQAGVNVNWLDCRPASSTRCVAPPESGGRVRLNLWITLNAAVTTKDQIFEIAYLAPDGAGQYGDVFWQRAKTSRPTRRWIWH